MDLLESDKTFFIYDRYCQFGSYFAELKELKAGIPNFDIINGRDNLDLILKLKNKGHNLKDGAILIHKNEIYYGYMSIKWICSQMEPSGHLLRILFKLMKSNRISKLIYPVLLLLRRLSLTIKNKKIDPLAN